MDESRLADRVVLLRGGWLFSDCTDDELERVAALVYSQHIPAGQVIVREGDPGSEFYVVVEGTTRVTVEGNHRRHRSGLVLRRDGVARRWGTGRERHRDHRHRSPVLHRDEFNEMLALAMPTIAPKLLAVVGRRVRALEARQGRGVPFGA